MPPGNKKAATYDSATSLSLVGSSAAETRRLLRDVVGAVELRADGTIVGFEQPAQALGALGVDQRCEIASLVSRLEGASGNFHGLSTQT
jgi:hypothetical protein